MPALLIRMSMRPNCDFVRSAIEARSARLVTSVGMTAARRPTSLTSLAVVSAPFWSSSAMTMSAPSLASSRAVARPIPRPAPVTMATCPCSSIESLLSDERRRRPVPLRPGLGAVPLAHQVNGPLARARLHEQLDLVDRGAPQRVARLVVRVGDLLAELVHGLVLLVRRRHVERLAADEGGPAGGGVRALHPAADLVPATVEEHDDRDGLVTVVEQRVAEVGLLVAEEHAQLGAGDGLDDVGDERRVAVDVAAPVLGGHDDVLDALHAAEELPLVVRELGLRVVLLGPGPGVAHLGHVVLPGHARLEPRVVHGDLALSH